VAAGAALDPSSRSDAFCDHTIRGDEVFVVPDLSRDSRFAGNPLVVGEPFFRFYAGAPLTYRRGIRLGALCVLDTRPRDFSRGDRAELAEMADRVLGLIADREAAALPGPALR
jgi:GAF domain-containing protein